MAITITAKPQDYTPSNNNIIWEFQSDNTNIVYYRVNIFISNNTSTSPSILLSTQDCYCTPDYPQKGHINISRLIRDTTKSIFRKGIPSDSNSYGMNSNRDNIVRYRLEITERIVSGANVVNGSTISTSGANYVFKGELDKVSFKSWNYNYYLVQSSTNFEVRFLTSKPSSVVTNVNEYSRDILYFLHKSFPFVLLRVEYTDISGEVNTKTITHEYYGTYHNSVGISKVDVHPLALFDDEEIATLSHYNVYLFDLVTNLRISEKRYYKYQDINCLQVPTNVVWLNKYGCYESIQFMAKESTLDVTKSTIKYNQIQRDTAGNLSEFDDYRFNAVYSVLNADVVTTWKLYTAELSDEENKWLSGIIASEKVYISISDDLWIPALLETNTYNLQRKRAMRDGLMIKDISFKLLEGYTDDYVELPVVIQDLDILSVESYFYLT